MDDDKILIVSQNLPKIFTLEGCQQVTCHLVVFFRNVIFLLSMGGDILWIFNFSIHMEYGMKVISESSYMADTPLHYTHILKLDFLEKIVLKVSSLDCFGLWTF